VRGAAARSDFGENCTIAFQQNGWWDSRISVWIWRCLGFSLTYVMLQNRILVWNWRCLGFSLTYVMLQNRILVWNWRGFTNLHDVVTRLQFIQSKNFPPKVSKRLKVFSFSTQQMIFIMSPLCGGGKLPSKPLHRGTADAEMKVPSVESPELRQVLPLKPGVGQNIEYSHACFAHFQE